MEIEFKFKVKIPKDTSKKLLDRLRKFFLCTENTINTVFPEVRVHISEKEIKTEG